MPCPDADAHRAQRPAAAGPAQLMTAAVTSRAPLAPSGMPERNGAAIRVHVRGVVGHAEGAQRRQHLRRERFVDFDEIDVGRSHAGLASSFGVAGTGPMPITRGGTPATADATTRARGVRPCRAPPASEATMSAAAPSLMPDALPAVIVPSARVIGTSRASASSVVSGRGCSSAVTVDAPFRWRTSPA